MYRHLISFKKDRATPWMGGRRNIETDQSFVLTDIYPRRRTTDVCTTKIMSSNDKNFAALQNVFSLGAAGRTVLFLSK
jgi:hypothetical protein